MFSASNDASLAPGVGVDYLTVAQGPLERSIALLTDKAMFQVRVLEEVKKEATGGRYTAALHFAEKEFAHSQELLKAIGEGTLGTRCAFEMPARTLIEYEWYCGWMDLQHQFARVAFKSQTHTLRTRSVTQIDEVKRVFETQLARQDAEKAALERNLQEVKATVAALVGEKANLESDLLASKCQFVSLQGLHADLVNQMATLEHDSTEKIANLERDLLDSYNRMKSETTKVAALEQECANARTELSHHVSSLEETQHALQAEVTGLRRHLDDAQKQMEVERMEKASLKASLEKSEESHRSTTEALKARIDALTDEKTKVSEALETERDKGAQLQTTINDLQARIHTVSESEAGKDTAAEEENQQLLQLEKVLASEAAAHNTLQSIKEQRVAEEISARDAQTELHGQIEALQARIDALTDEKTKMSEALETERGKGAQLQTTINDLQAARPMNAQDPTTGVTNAMSLEELQAQFDTQLKKCQTEHQYSLSVKEYRFFVAGRLTHFKGLLTARQKVDRDDWTKWWNIAQRLVATTAAVDDVGGSDEFVIALESLEQLIAARCDAVKVDDSFFSGRQEDEKPHFHVMLDVAVLVDLLTGNDDKRATAARAAFNTSVTNLARAAEEMIKQNGESPLFRAVRNILTGSTKHPTGRQGFSFLAAASEIYTFLTELSKRSRATGLCDIDALVTVHIIDPFKAALQSRLPSPSSTPDVEAWAKAIVEAYEWVNDKRTKEGAIVQLGAKAAQFGQLLNAAIEFIFDPVKMRDIRAIRDAVWSIGNAEVLRLPPFQRLEGVDLRTIADHWDTPSAAKLTMTSSDGPTPREETIDAQQRLAARIDVVMTQANSVIDRFMLHELQTLASAEHVRVELRAAALKAADAAIANPRDVEAQLQLIAHAAAIASWCMTPTSGMRDLVKTSNPDEREKGLLLIPHRLQLAAVLRVFGLHTDGKADFLADALAGSKAAEARLSTFAHNHLLEVGTGQGKSLILGVIGIAVALVGVDVDVVCYNRLLSRRDRAGMVGFDCGVAGVDCGISYFLGDKAPRYLTFTELADELVSELRDRTGALLCSPHRPTTPPSSPSKTEHAQAPRRHRLILVDEVDAFFEIANQTYTAGVTIDIDATRGPMADLCRLLYNCRGVVADDDTKAQVAQLRDAIAAGLPEWVASDFGRAFVEHVVQELVSKATRVVGPRADASNAFGHTFKNDCEIGMVDESDYFDPNFRDTYIAPFLYWRETSRVGGALNEAKCGELKRSVHSLRVALPPVTYSWLLQHCYMGMIGLSGTLRTLPTALLDYMQQDHLVGPIKRWTFVPPVHLLQQRDGKCGIIPRDATVPWTQVHASQLLCASFKHATALYDHTRDCAPYVDQIMRSAKPEAEWSNLIAKSVRQHRDQTRAVVGGGQALVVFDDAARLAQFLASDAGAALAKDVGVDHLVTLDQGLSREQVDERVHNAMKPRTVTLMTRSYGRGTDFKAGKRDVVLVVQTFVSRTLSDEIQIRGRTARADRAGRYLLMFCPTHLAHLGVPDHAGAANAVVQADLTQGASDPSFVVLRKQRDDRVTEDMKLLQASLKRTVRSTKDFAKLHDPECPFLDQVAVLRDYNAGKSLQGKNITIDLVIDVSASMRNPLSTTEPLPRYIAMRNNLTALYNDVLHKLADVKWNLVVFGNKCFHCSGDNGQPYSFDDKTVTPHGVLEAHLNTKGFQMGTHFLPAAQQLADIIRRDTILTVESVNADGSTATSLVPPQHYVFWFTDGAPDDAITNIECNYDVALYAPCRALFAELRNRIAAFQVAIFAGADINAVKVDIVRTFSECWEGRTDKAVDARELKQTLEVFGETVRESVLR